jgi:hypothetical protein
MCLLVEEAAESVVVDVEVVESARVADRSGSGRSGA